jgi:hypothetical protein
MCVTCAGLIRLCGGLDFFPADPEVRALLIERLHRVAKDHQHAKAMIDHWLDEQRVAPKIADLVALASHVRSASEGLPDGCSICHGEPWVIGPNGAARCSCARGQALRQMSIRREHEHARWCAGLSAGGNRRPAATMALVGFQGLKTGTGKSVSNEKGEIE